MEGKSRSTISGETTFCRPDVLSNVLARKVLFKDFDEAIKKKAIYRSNPFSMIGRGKFQNRSAIKMANMDALFGFMFTKPVDEKSESLVKADEVLSFADVCGGPGGFSEYVLWRIKNACGIGFTLKNELDFNLDAFIGGRSSNFHVYYGRKGDGDIYDPDNIESLTDHILNKIPLGVHFMMSDGGFDVSKCPRARQEIISKKLYLCQCLVALSIVREKGHFVTKLCDIFTPFSAGLVYLMHKSFNRITIVKPNTSRPNSSERYLICKWKRPNTDVVRDHLMEANRRMFERTATSENDVLELVPLEVLKKDQNFFDFFCNSNNNIAESEYNAMMKIAEFFRIESRQIELKRKCLELWDLPNEFLDNAPRESTTPKNANN